jgi:hypothetical protein
MAMAMRTSSNVKPFWRDLRIVKVLFRGLGFVFTGYGRKRPSGIISEGKVRFLHPLCHKYKE